jgi:hypothetical protein
VKGSSRSGDQTFVQELALAKPLKPSRKFISQSSDVKIGGGKTSSTSACGGGSGRAPAHVLDLFGSGSSASNGEAAVPMPH